MKCPKCESRNIDIEVHSRNYLCINCGYIWSDETLQEKQDALCDLIRKDLESGTGKKIDMKKRLGDG